MAVTFIVSGGCATRYVEGLVLDIENALVAVSRLDSGDGSTIVPGERARFSFKGSIVSGKQQDFVVFVRGTGTLVVHLFESNKDKQPVASARFSLLEGKAAELHIAIPDGVSLALAELGLIDDGSATVTAFSVVPTFVGARFEATSYVVSSGTAYTIDSGFKIKSCSITLPDSSDSSLMFRLGADGSAIISILSQDSVPQSVFTATVRTGVDVAIPVVALQHSELQRPNRVSVTSEAGLTSVWLAAGAGAPFADLHAILAVTAPVFVDYALYRWDLFPETLVFDFADYAVQDRYLKRLAFFAEKPGFKGRIASDEEIESLHGWNSHDYSTGTLSAFFSQALTQNFILNQHELALLELLISYGILTRTSSGVISEGVGAVISLSRESTPGLRRMFMDHEASHALFFQDADYRKLSAIIWNSLGPEARRFWIQHFMWRRYDTQDEDLMINELQAYLVQQSVPSVSVYYEALLKRLADAYPAYRERLASESSYVLDSAVTGAHALDSYLSKRLGLSAGKFGRIKKY